ncbi:hypothetical protein HXX76_002046 [Chlamydomonas incerta]|uniref:asparaginase n=1 Tax=Chlamydomonas incerta TaxID=51695 RepID=A0A835WAB7_CHLIN|nr:hypothetical protein HXX76_002046 [Chlamydomonas incerta]|eukprot:KAG2443698.1 hypothetical protein HXX76_002046 [Chlamydomonas incerta]
MAGIRTRIRELPGGRAAQPDARCPHHLGRPARRIPVCSSGKGEAQNSLDALGPLPGGLGSLLGGPGATPGWKRSSSSPPESTTKIDSGSQAFIAFGRRPNGRLYAASDGTISGGEHAPGARSTDDEEPAEADDPMFMAARARQEEERAEAAAWRAVSRAAAAGAVAAAAKRPGVKAAAAAGAQQGAGGGTGEGEGGGEPALQQRRRGRGGRRTTVAIGDGDGGGGQAAAPAAPSGAGAAEKQPLRGQSGRSRGGVNDGNGGGGGGSGGGGSGAVMLTGADGSMWEVPQQGRMELAVPSPAAAAAAVAAAEPSTADTRRRRRRGSRGTGSDGEGEGSASGTEAPSSADGLLVSAAAALPAVAAVAAVATASSSGRGGSSSTSTSTGAGAGGSSSRPGWATPGSSPRHGRLRTVTKPLPRVLFLHTGGTLGMDPEEAFEEDESHNLRPRAGASDSYKGSLRPGEMLSSLLTMVPELDKFANVDLQVVFNKDSSRVGPQDWIHIARVLHANRAHYDAFVVVHGTDTLAYTASALSLMLCGFKKPIVLTGSQLPLRAPRTDARQNLLDSIQVATSASSPPHVELQEVAVCFGGKLMRGNRTQKVNSAAYQAFDSLTYPYLATLGIDVDWNTRYLLRAEGAYKPRFKLDPRVIRIPVVPGSDPRTAYGDLYGRGVRGVVLEAFGVGNLPDQPGFGWIPWLKEQTAKGLQVCLTSQCSSGPLQPALYHAGQLAAEMGVDAGPHMTPECAAVKMMFCLEHPDLALGVPLAGEL